MTFDTAGAALVAADLPTRKVSRPTTGLEFHLKNRERIVETVATKETGSSSRSLPVGKIENLGGLPSQTCSAECCQGWLMKVRVS
jgi:hypothetical protein